MHTQVCRHVYTQYMYKHAHRDTCAHMYTHIHGVHKHSVCTHKYTHRHAHTRAHTLPALLASAPVTYLGLDWAWLAEAWAVSCSWCRRPCAGQSEGCRGVQGHRDCCTMDCGWGKETVGFPFLCKRRKDQLRPKGISVVTMALRSSLRESKFRTAGTHGSQPRGRGRGTCCDIRSICLLTKDDCTSVHGQLLIKRKFRPCSPLST